MSGQAGDFWRLLYRSEARIDGLEMMKAIASLLAVSARNNLRDRITGLFVHNDGAFVQVLEGDRALVEACYRRIAADDRHRNLEILIAEPAEQRLFPRWSMGFVDAMETEDFTALSRKLRSGERDALDAMIEIGSEHGLIQRALV